MDNWTLIGAVVVIIFLVIALHLERKKREDVELQSELDRSRKELDDIQKELDRNKKAYDDALALLANSHIPAHMLDNVGKSEYIDLKTGGLVAGGRLHARRADRPGLDPGGQEQAGRVDEVQSELPGVLGPVSETGDSARDLQSNR